MKKSSLEIKDEKNQLKEKALRMIETCKTEIREFTPEEKEEFDSIKSQIEALNEQLKTLEESLREDPTEEEDKEEEIKDPETEKEEDPVEEEPKEEENSKRNIMKQKFSLLKAIRNIANNKTMDPITSAVVEAGANEMRKAGLNYTGQIQLPCEERATITVATEGEDVVATDLFDVVKPLQARNVMIQAGAKYITGLVSNIQYPVLSNASCAWEGETDAAADGAPTFTNVKLSPKRLSVVVPISKQFIVQDSVGAENAIREEIINAINAKIEATILGAGAGSLTEPKGFFPSEGDGGLTAINDFKALTALEGELEEKNIYGDLKYLVSPKAKADLRNMSKSTKSTQLVYENGEIDGTEALSTSHLKDKHIIYGDFSQYIIAQWGTIDLVVDPLTLAADGQIRLVANAYFDMKPLREDAFKVAKVGA